MLEGQQVYYIYVYATMSHLRNDSRNKESIRQERTACFCSLCIKLHFDLHNTDLFLLLVTSGVSTEQQTLLLLSEESFIWWMLWLNTYMYSFFCVFGVFQMPMTGLCVFLRTTVRELLMSLLTCLLYTSPSPRDSLRSRMPSSA